MFLISTGLMLGFTFSLSCHYFVLIKDNTSELGNAISNAPVALGLMIYCGIVFLPVLCLTSYHVNIISSGVTTKEEIKRIYAGGVNPNDHGCWHNWKMVLCGNRAATKLPEMTALVNQSNWADVPEDDDDDSTLLVPVGGASSSSGRPQIDIEMGNMAASGPPPYGQEDTHTDTEEISVSPMKSPNSSSISPLKSPSSSSQPPKGRLTADDVSSADTPEANGVLPDDAGDGISPLRNIKSHTHLTME